MPFILFRLNCRSDQIRIDYDVNGFILRQSISVAHITIILYSTVLITRAFLILSTLDENYSHRKISINWERVYKYVLCIYNILCHWYIRIRVDSTDTKL